MSTTIIYLVGTNWFSPDQGDFPNTHEFPSYCFATLEEADVKYQELARKDRDWGHSGFQEAYIVAAVPGQQFSVLKGRLGVDQLKVCHTLGRTL